MIANLKRLAVLGAVVAGISGPALASDILITDVTLIDGTGAPPLAGASVLVSGERIALVSPSDIRKPRGAIVIKGKGKYLIPGLIDTHIHLRGGTERGKFINDRTLAIPALHTFLYSGVTTVNDLGNNPEFIFPIRDDERAARIVSPRIFAAGNAIGFPRRTAEGGGVQITGRNDVRGKIDAMLGYKADMIKIVYDGTDSLRGEMVDGFPGLVRDIVHHANDHGTMVTAHIGGREDFKLILDAGINTFAHAPIRDRLDEATLKSVAARRVPISTTAVVFSNIARVADDTSWLDTPLFHATLDEKTLELQKVEERQRYRTSGMSERFKPLVDNMLWNLGALHEAGAILALGSDRTYGPMSLQEIELYAKAGIPLLDCITIATRNAALYLGREHDLGTIARGKLADLVLLDADPTANVANFATVNTVIKGGQIIDLKALDLPVNRKGRK
ncbi:MAG: amidohydrolase family protein [Alphaproteobacteria bacterium]|nr:amidohydrolase family protein [Alphaproteobacteria bacterium]